MNIENNKSIYNKPKIKNYTRRGKKHSVKVFSIKLIEKRKSIKTLEEELKLQKFKGCPANCIKPKLKGKTSAWKRGSEFPANRPRVGDSGRTRWTKGNKWSNEDNESSKSMKISSGRNK